MENVVVNIIQGEEEYGVRGGGARQTAGDEGRSRVNTTTGPRNTQTSADVILLQRKKSINNVEEETTVKDLKTVLYLNTYIPYQLMYWRMNKHPVNKIYIPQID